MSAIAESDSPKYHVYRRRWFMLVILMGYGYMNTLQWVQFSIIANVIMRYYNVSSYAVDWTSILFIGIYVPLAFPASYVLEKWGLRRGMVAGLAMMAAGAWIKCLSAERDRFAVTLVGQTLVGASQTFLLSVPPLLAATWFGSEQVSTACSLGILGLQLGAASGFLATPLLVRNHTDLEDVGRDLSRLFYIVAGVCTTLLVVAIALFEAQPPLAPSVEVFLQRQRDSKGAFRASLRRLLCDCRFLALALSYGLNLGVFNAFSMMINQLILIYFPDGQEFAGRVGLVFIASGMVGAVLCGVTLDKSHRYRETTIASYGLATGFLLALTFIFALESTILVYLFGGGFGIFMGAYLTVSFEYGVELTYPECESTMAGVLLIAAQVLGVLFTALYGWLLNEIGDVWANMALVAIMTAGTAITALIRSDLRRQAAYAMSAKTSTEALPAAHAPLTADATAVVFADTPDTNLDDGSDDVAVTEAVKFAHI